MKTSDIHRDVLKGRFIDKVLKEQGVEMIRAQTNLMAKRKFKEVNQLARRTKTSEEKLTLEVNKVLRFIDMKRRKLRSGRRIKKKSHPIYNRIIFGHLNNIASELMYGFTEATIEEMKNLEK